MAVHVEGTYGFKNEAQRAEAERAFRETTSIPAGAISGDGPLLSLKWDAGDQAYDSIRSALVALSEAAAGGHADLRAPGRGRFRGFGGDTPWSRRPDELPDDTAKRLGSLAFRFDRGVGSVAFGPHGELAAGGMQYARGAVALFDAGGAEKLYAWAHTRPDDHYGSQWVAVALSPAGDRVVSGSCDKRAVVRDVRSGRPLAVLEHGEMIADVAWLGETIVTLGERTAALWNEPSFKLPTKLNHAGGRALGAAPGGGLLLLSQGVISRLDTASEKLVDALNVGPGVVAAASDGRHAVAVEKGRKVAKVVALHAGKKKTQVKLAAPPVALGFARDGALIAALEDGTVVVANAAGQIVEEYRVATKLWSGTRIASAVDGRIALATGGKVPVLIDRARRAVICTPDRLDAVVTSPVDATFILLGERARWIDPIAGSERALPEAQWAAFSADGALLAIHDGTLVKVLDSASLSERVSRKASPGDRLLLSPDGGSIASVSRELSLIDLASGKARKLGKKDERFWTAAFSPDGATLAAADTAKIALFDTASGKLTMELAGEAIAPSHLAFSGDGLRLAASGDKALGVWEIASRKQLFAVEEGAGSLSWAPDGATLAAGQWGQVTLFDGQSGAVKERLHGHIGSVYSVGFTGDGSRLVSVGEEGTALIVGRASTPLPSRRPAESAAPSALAERVAAAEEARRQKAAEAAQQREEVRVAKPEGAALAPARRDDGSPSPAMARHAMRLRAHGTLLFPSRAALDEGVRKFAQNAYVEWYSEKDLVIDERTVRIDLETDLEVDCVTFGVSFLELAKRAEDGAVVVEWDDQVTSMRFAGGAYGFEAVVPLLPPGALARHGQLPERLTRPTLVGVSSQAALAGNAATSAARTTDHAVPIVAMAASAQLLATLDESGELVVRARLGGELALRHRFALKAKRSAHLVLSGQGLALADSERLILIDVAGGTLRELEKNKLTCAAWCEDGTLLTGHADGKVRLSSSAGAQVIEVGGDVRRVAVSARAERFACLFKDGTVAVLEGSEKKLTLKASKEYPAMLALSPDGRTLAFARSQKQGYSVRGEVLLRDVETNDERAVLSRARPGACLFSRDSGRLFVTDDRSIRVIDQASGALTGTIVGHSGEVRALALPGDGTLISASVDQTAVEWDLAAIEALGGGHPAEETGIPD